MRILISNDDGVQAPGIRVLAEHLKRIGEVFVVAPDRQRSAAGHGITLHKPLYVQRHDWGEGIQVYGVSGTPADCVKLGVSEIMKDALPDIIVSGINAGENLGNDVMYSGTVSAAVEGAVQGIPSIAVSLVGWDDLDYTEAAAFTVRLVQQVKQHGLPEDSILNVNVPSVACEGTREVRVTTLGKRRYHNEYDKRVNPRGKAYYWLAGDLKDLPNPPDADVVAIVEGAISVSPVQFDFTHRPLIETIKNWTLGSY